MACHFTSCGASPRNGPSQWRNQQREDVVVCWNSESSCRLRPPTTRLRHWGDELDRQCPKAVSSVPCPCHLLPNKSGGNFVDFQNLLLLSREAEGRRKDHGETGEENHHRMSKESSCHSSNDGQRIERESKSTRQSEWLKTRVTDSYSF